MNEIAVSAITSFACGTLANEMWRSANKVAQNQKARDQVFRAAQRVLPFIHLQPQRKDIIVNRFEFCVRTGSLISGGVSLAFAIKLLIKLM